MTFIEYTIPSNIILYFQDIANLIQAAHHSYQTNREAREKEIVLLMFYARELFWLNSQLHSTFAVVATLLNYGVTTDSIHQNSFQLVFLLQLMQLKSILLQCCCNKQERGFILHQQN